MKKYYLICAALAVCMLMTVGFIRMERQSGEDLYGAIIAGLGDDEQFALLDFDEGQQVLLTTDFTYDDGNGNSVAINCNVCIRIDGKAYYALGSIESMGTAYPVSYDKGRLYTASGHDVTVYTFDMVNRQWVTTQYEEVFDENGTASYYRITTGTASNQNIGMRAKEAVSEEDFLAVMEEYGEAEVVSFGYGAGQS